MRAVVFHLRDATEIDVAAFLTEAFPVQPGPRWILANEDRSACLYIELYRDAEVELEPSALDELRAAFGGQIPRSVIAHVSGRWAGDDAVRQLAALLLSRFGGSASDEHIDHLWSLEEIQNDGRVDGQRFFDDARRP